ncbi:MAG: NPCBM/NEW2 domain-containing protein [Clostridia bacterium]|nr:NPCBM/NEW2 domain-containing protein [Clostridia bacterium]
MDSKQQFQMEQEQQSDFHVYDNQIYTPDVYERKIRRSRSDTKRVNRTRRRKKRTTVWLGCALAVSLVVIALLLAALVNPGAQTQRTFENAKEIAFAKAEQRLQSGDYSGAITALSDALTMLPNDEELWDERQILEKNYCDELIAQADIYWNQNRYHEAYTVLETVAQLFPGNTEWGARQRQVYIAIIMEEAKNNYPHNINTAIALLNGIYITPEENMQAYELLTQYRTEYRKTVLAEAENAYAESGYTAAAKVIQSAFAVMPDDELLMRQYNVYMNDAPVDLLSEFEPFLQERNRIETSEKDNIGNNYLSCIVNTPNNDDQGSISFLINYEYEVLTGTVFLRKQSQNTDYEAWTKIYGDGLLLYSSPPMTAGSMPETFSVDISGVRLLEFICEDNTALINGGACIGIGNLTLYK